EIDGGGARRADRVTAGRVFVDGKSIGDTGGIVLRDRRHLSEGGMVLAVLAIAQQSGELVAGPDLISHGLVGEEASPDLLEPARAAVLEALEAVSPQARTGPNEGKEGGRPPPKPHFPRPVRRP